MVNQGAKGKFSAVFVDRGVCMRLSRLAVQGVPFTLANSIVCGGAWQLSQVLDMLFLGSLDRFRFFYFGEKGVIKDCLLMWLIE